MAKVKIQGNASGTGILTVTAPNTSTDRTLTLPDATGTLSVGSSIEDNGNATAITIDSTELVSFANAVVIPATINAGSSGSSEGTTGRINFGGVSGSINGFTITNENGNYLDIKPNSSSNGIKILNDGGMCFGTDTATANALDDYEEGVATMTCAAYSGTITMNTASDQLSYIKIGRLVFIQGEFTFSTATNPALSFVIYGLPFTPASLSEGAGGGHINSLLRNANSECVGLKFYIFEGQSTLYGREDGRLNDGSHCANYIDTDSYLSISGSYYASA